MRWCCSAPPLSKSVSAGGCWRPSCAARPCRTSSLRDGTCTWPRQDGSNAFASEDDYLSATGRQFVAGLLEHAMPMTVFAAPTVNGYKRFRPYSFAPDRVCWALENRGTLVRVQGAPGDANSHVEQRMGEPAANQ